ncbi:hypothetical protein COBT_001522 [Conglomerata obtusa]
MTRDQYDRMLLDREEARRRSEATPFRQQPEAELPGSSINKGGDIIMERLKDKKFISLLIKYINDQSYVNEVVSFLPKLTIISDVHSLNVVVSIIVTLLHVKKVKISINYEKAERDLIYRKIVESYIRYIKNQMFEQFRESNYNGICLFTTDKELMEPTINMIVGFIDKIRLRIEPLRTVDDVLLDSINQVVCAEIDPINVMEICNVFENN